MKGQDKTPEKQPRQPSRKRIQNNDSEDDSGSWKKMATKIEKMQKMFTKDLEELKKKQTDE